MKCKTIREGDEYACSCGLRWGIDEDDPHTEGDVSREKRAEQLIRDLYMECRESQNTNLYNPYTWAELNPELMQRIKEFM